MTIIQLLGLIGAVVMPFWNIPLVIKIVKRKSANDISLLWVSGVWVCVVLMLPSALVSLDPVLKIFGIINAISFTAVFFTVLKYHKPKGSE